MLDVFFWGLNQEQGTSTPHGNCMCLWSLVQNPRRSQGISRLFSQSPERTLEKKKKNRKIYAFRTSFPLAIPKRVTLQLFWAFSLLSGSPAGLEDTENKAAFISGSLVDIHHGLGPVPSTWMATHGLHSPERHGSRHTLHQDIVRHELSHGCSIAQRGIQTNDRTEGPARSIG